MPQCIGSSVRRERSVKEEEKEVLFEEEGSKEDTGR